ncbi:MAG: threonine--tRNA ligase [Defluviitaleaceae bacterium]|nr:threonine--tRNA ligase [Defluviitaleaceae bacterium]
MEKDLNTLRHTAAHVLAQAVKRLFPDVKLAIGPSIEDGFYYDFETPTPFTPDDLKDIEKEMKKIVKEGHNLEESTLSRDEALAFVDKQGEPYKRELLEDLYAKDTNAVATFYKQGDFVDLCAGPHMPRTRDVKAFKLLSVAGAYWRGDEKRAMLSRIYGTAFFTKDELHAHIERLEEAKKRDHNKVGRELEYFTTVDYIGQGLPILMPKGAKVLQLLQRFVEDEEARRGYLLTKTPFMAKRDLYKISGHWDKYRDDMFLLGNPDDALDESKEMLALRPMTCPFQFQVYLSKTRSYRDLPMRFNETATLFRNESSGSMHGLIRVRQFTLSEGHIACTPDQVEDEFKGCIDLAQFLLEKIGLAEDITYRFSKWDAAAKEKYIGDEKEWEHTQGFMKKILDNSGISYVEADGEAAFYGPKLDIQIKNVHGKEDTLITIQIDFQLAERFGMTYVDAESTKQHPYIIHRSSIGCYERTLALLLEKTAGAMPFWLAPTQFMVIPIAERHQEAAQVVVDKLTAANLRAEADMRNEKMGLKIREAQLQKIPLMLVLGDNEIAENKVSIRSRENGDEGQQDLTTAIENWKTQNSW